MGEKDSQEFLMLKKEKKNLPSFSKYERMQNL